MAAPGLEILFCAVKEQLSSNCDALVTIFHWNLVSAGYKCNGVGEQPHNDDSISEMLPSGWNANQDLYTLRYKHSGKNFLLKVIRIDNDLLVNFMNVQEEKVVTMNVRTSEYTTGNRRTFSKAYQNLDALCKHFKKEIISEISKEDTSSRSRPTQRPERPRTHEEDYDPLRVPPRHTQRPPPDWHDPEDPFSIGRGDLDPLARGGGGMLFDPMRGRRPEFGPDPSAGLPGRLPPGAVPPGARFDPFGPPGTRPGPDPDHEQPPGYDDMFM